MTTPDDVLRSPVRRNIIDLLAASADTGLDAGSIADHTGLHVTTVRFHLDQLEGVGLIRSASRKGEGAGRPRKVYLAAPTPPEHESTPAERERKSLALLSELLSDMVAAQGNGATLTPEEAGEKWARENVNPNASTTPAATPGEWLSKVGALTDVLRDWGYVRTVTTSDDRNEADVRLTHCPFRELAKANPAVVCGIHRGLIKGTMRKLGESTTQANLLPFADGNTCVAHLKQNHTEPPVKES